MKNPEYQSKINDFIRDLSMNQNTLPSSWDDYFNPVTLNYYKVLSTKLEGKYTPINFNNPIQFLQLFNNTPVCPQAPVFGFEKKNPVYDKFKRHMAGITFNNLEQRTAIFIDIDIVEGIDWKEVYNFITKSYKSFYYISRTSSGGYHALMNINEILDTVNYKPTISNFVEKVNELFPGCIIDDKVAVPSQQFNIHNTKLFWINENNPSSVKVEVLYPNKISRAIAGVNRLFEQNDNEFDISDNYCILDKMEEIPEMYQKQEWILIITQILVNLGVDPRPYFSQERSRQQKIEGVMLNGKNFKTSKEALKVMIELGYISEKVIETESTESITLFKNQYLGDYYENVFNKLIKNDKLMIISPTNSGKTTLIEQFTCDIMNANSKFIVTFPYNSITSNKLKSFIELDKENKNDRSWEMRYIKCVYDRIDMIDFNYYNCNDILFVDEIHMLLSQSNFREGAVDKLDKFINNFPGKVILMTGTSSFEEYIFPNFDKIEFVRDNYNKPHNIIIRKVGRINAAMAGESIKLLKNNKKVMLCANISLKKQENMKEVIMKETGLNDSEIAIIRSEDKGMGGVLDYITENSLVPDQIRMLIATSVVEVGIDINNEDEWITICGRNINDPDQVLQFGERFRKISKNIMWIRTKSDDIMDYNVKETITSKINNINMIGKDAYILFPSLYDIKVEYFQRDIITKRRFKAEAYNVFIDESSAYDKADGFNQVSSALAKEEKEKEMELFKSLDPKVKYIIVKEEGVTRVEDNKIFTRNTDRAYSMKRCIRKYNEITEEKEDLLGLFEEMNELLVDKFKTAWREANISKMLDLITQMDAENNSFNYYTEEKNIDKIKMLVAKKLIKERNGCYEGKNPGEMDIIATELNKEISSIANKIKLNNKLMKNDERKVEILDLFGDTDLNDIKYDLNGLMLKMKGGKTPYFNYIRSEKFPSIEIALDAKYRGICKIMDRNEYWEFKSSQSSKEGYEYDHDTRTLYREVKY